MGITQTKSQTKPQVVANSYIPKQDYLEGELQQSYTISQKKLKKELASNRNIESLGEQISILLGLDDLEVKIYLNLLRIGPVSASALAKEIDLERTKMYRTMEKLINQNIVSTTFSKPKLCIAADPEELLKMTMQRKEDDLKRLRLTKETVIKNIKEIVPIQEAPKVPTFHIVQGSSNIYSEIGKLIENSSGVVFIVTTLNDISKMYHTSIPEKIKICERNGGEVRLLTELNDYDLVPYVERIGATETKLSKLSSKGRITVEQGKQMIMSDATMRENSQTHASTDFAFSTNSHEMVNNIYTLCSLLWKNSKPLKVLAN